MWKADADASATVPVVAMAGAAILADAAGAFILNGFVRDNAWSWTVGGLIYASTTSGGLTQTKPSGSGDQVQIVGWAKASNIMYFNPSLDVLEIE
jgi:hypothetical protein